MNLRKGLITKIISTTILFFFLWSSGGIFNLAYAATKDSGQGSVASGQKKDKSAEERFQEALERVREAEDEIERSGETEKGEREIKDKRVEIETLDIEIKKQFRETEDKIKDLPNVIKQRHKDFINKYEENLNTLKTNLDEIDKAKTKEEKKQAHQKTKDFLEKTKPPSKHVPLDPNKLPHRTVEPKFKEPRTKPEEFAKDSKQYAVNSRQQKPILIASNGPLTGLLDSPLPIADSLSPLMLAAATNPSASSGQALPTADDLAETIEVQFTDDIKAKAAELNNNPVKIYEWVRNNIAAFNEQVQHLS